MSYIPPQYPQDPYGAGRQPYGQQPPDAGGPQQPYGQQPPDGTGPATAGEPPLGEAWYGADVKQAVSRFVQKAAHFQGYASRGEYWWVALGLFVINAVLGVVADSLDGTGAAGLVSGLTGVWNLVVLIPLLALTWRRLHDAGYAGSWFFIGLVPVIGWIWLVVLLAMPTNVLARRREWFDTNPTPTITWTWR